VKDQTRADIERERAELRDRFGDSYRKLEALLFEEDPIGINFDDNTDEYDPEVQTILPRLSSCATADDVQSVVHEEFCRWFDTEIAGARSRYKRISVRIFDELREIFPRRTN
jgi:hypothetical protein